MQPLSDHELATLLRELRPVPDADFARRLDTRVSAGFSCEGQPSPLQRLLTWLHPTRHRLLTAAAAGAVAAIAIATVVISIGGSGKPGTKLNRDAKPSGSLASEAVLKPTDGKRLRPPKVEASSEAESLASQDFFGPQTRHRDIERGASIVLQTDPGEVRRASAKVFEAVHTMNGIVLSSSIRDSGEGGDASFQLLVPSASLGDALASFSAIAAVNSRHESTADATAHTVGLGERLEDSRATVRSLLSQLAASRTDGERAAAEARLRAERRRVAAIHAQLAALHRRTAFSRVSLRIVSGNSGAAVGGGTWGVGAALADAGRILEIAAGVTLVGIAALAPIALLALLAWLGRRQWLRVSRQRALG